MQHSGTALSMFAVSMFAVSMLLTVVAATAQTCSVLYTYPGTSNNTSGAGWPAQLSQGQDGELYSTIQTNGVHNSGSVYKITSGGSTPCSIPSAPKPRVPMAPFRTAACR